MAIRLIDQYPNRAGTPNADYPHGVPRNRSAPGAVDGTPFEQSWFRDQEGFFQGLIETAGITPSGAPDTVQSSDYLNALVSTMHGVTEVDVGGVGDVTLGIYPSRVAALRLTGILGADVDLIVPNTARLYTIIDETTGSFSVTVRTETGTGVTIGESVSVVRSDGTDVVSANPAPDLGQNIAVFDTPGVTEWTVPDVLQAGLRKAHVTVVGGGGGGGLSSSTSERAAGGGGGGGAMGVVDLQSVTSIEITVGTGGSGAATAGSGASGGSSSFGTMLSATGGGGGGNQVGSGGAKGLGTGGDINVSGGSGSDGTNATAGGGSGDGGQSIFGGGGRSASSYASADVDGFAPGSGGGGTAAGAPQGGNGGNGIVIVRW
jgi:hypothetical protein